MLTQSEADYLMELEKRFAQDDVLILGAPGIRIERELISVDGRERFWLDIYQGRIELRKFTLQERARAVVPLVRLDIGSTLRHTNPDETVITGPHIHVFREGYDLKFATALADFSFAFRDPGSLPLTLGDFARYCHIIGLPMIQEKLL